MAKEKTLPRQPRYHYHFKFPIFEFFFQWLAGAQTHGCSEGGECFYAAAKIREADGESWYNALTDMAKRVEARAQTSTAAGHKVSARESYLRAYTYYRAATAFLDPIYDSRHLPLYHKSRQCFVSACDKFDPPILPVEIPFEGKMLPAYLIRPADDGVRTKTLLMIGGGDTYVEDLYACMGPAGVKRDYNVIIVDLPGQGDLPSQGLPFRPDVEVPVSAVIDYILKLPGVDADRLVSYGLSFGGYIVPRAASVDKRIKAVAVCSALLDGSALFPDSMANFERLPRFKLAKVLMKTRMKTTLAVFHTYFWRWGAVDSAGLVAELKKYIVDPSLISCPFLNVVAQQEYEQFPAAQEWAKACQEKIANPEKKLVIAPTNEGADSHGVGTNLSLMAQIIFDWFDEILDKSAG
jgi:dienelactone hydrolase